MDKKLVEQQMDDESDRIFNELFSIDLQEESEEDCIKRQKFENGCKSILNLLIDSDIKKIISEMIRTWDKGGIFFDCRNAENILKTSLSNFSAILPSVERMALEETKDWEKDYNDNYVLFFYDSSKEKHKESCIKHARERIFKYILDEIQKEAHKIRDKRVYLRIAEGMPVDFKMCESAIPYNEHVEFYKDGGWGISTIDGIVKITNNIITQPSKCKYCNYISFDPFLRIVKSRDNGKYGVLSLNSFELIIPFEYKRIEEFGDGNDRPKCSLLKGLNDNGWGCFNGKGRNVINCQYDGIELCGDLIECYREGGYIENDELKPHTGDVFYDGKRDLYDKNGNLLIGGYSLRTMASADICYYYFGTSYESYSVKESDIWDRYEFDLWKYRVNYDNSVCLLLDGNLRSVVKIEGKIFQFPIGKCIESPQELIPLVPEQILFHNEIDFWNGHFIFQKQRLGEKTIVQETRIIKTYQPHKRPATEEEKALSLAFGGEAIEEIEDGDYVYSEETENVIREDDRVCITGLSEENDILWSACVNELGRLKSQRLPVYRKGFSVGFYSECGLDDASFVAVTYKDGKYYVAKQEFENELEKTSFKNLNYLGKITCKRGNDDFKDGRHLFLRYYEYSDGRLTRMSDDWKVFNPAKLDWFPDSYKTIYHIYGNDGDSDYYDGPEREPEYTDEDAWDAMTDGMYGDYPGSGWDSEYFGY